MATETSLLPPCESCGEFKERVLAALECAKNADEVIALLKIADRLGNVPRGQETSVLDKFREKLKYYHELERQALTERHRKHMVHFSVDGSHFVDKREEPDNGDPRAFAVIEGGARTA